MAKTIAEINRRIQRGEAVVVDADEMADLVEDAGVSEASRYVDVVATATFGPMCSSGIYFNTGHAQPKIKFGGGAVTLNGVPAHGGLAAADLYLGATALPDDDPRNQEFPGAFRYGGGHVIEDLVAGKEVLLRARAYGTDCYPRKEIELALTLEDLNEAVLFNPRNCYQNYNVAVNRSDRTIYTYMGVLRANLTNARYCSAGQLSPLLNDPLYRTIGIGTRIFLGGGIGYVAWQGTQHNPAAPRKGNMVPCAPAGTVAVIGDLKGMSPEHLVGTSMTGYGVTLSVGIGIPIPILDEEMARFTAVRDRDIWAQIVDYGTDYPHGTGRTLGQVTYAELKSGRIHLSGKTVPVASLCRHRKAKHIAGTLKAWIQQGRFQLTRPVAGLPGPESGYRFRPMKRPVPRPTVLKSGA